MGFSPRPVAVRSGSRLFSRCALAGRDSAAHVTTRATGGRVIGALAGRAFPSRRPRCVPRNHVGTAPHRRGGIVFRTTSLTTASLPALCHGLLSFFLTCAMAYFRLFRKRDNVTSKQKQKSTKNITHTRARAHCHFVDGRDRLIEVQNIYCKQKSLIRPPPLTHDLKFRLNKKTY